MALGCQETVQTLLEREISSTTEVANPDSVGFCEAQGSAANCVSSEGNHYWTEGSTRTCGDGREGGRAEQENAEKVEFEENKWQEQDVSKVEPSDSDTRADQRESECDEKDSAKNLSNEAEGENVGANQVERIAMQPIMIMNVMQAVCTIHISPFFRRNWYLGSLKTGQKRELK